MRLGIRRIGAAARVRISISPAFDWIVSTVRVPTVRGRTPPSSGRMSPSAYDDLTIESKASVDALVS
jgi:hypothetical protein